MITGVVVTDLARFTGRAVATFTDFAAEALTQATLLFSLNTTVVDDPSDTNELALTRYAILQMADHIYLEQPHARAKASPFNSETIGSYSYSKGSAAARALAGDKSTGLMWWDLAMQRLTQNSNSRVASGTAFRVPQHSLVLDSSGVATLVSPADSESDQPPLEISSGRA